jgi:hypothetical protein
MFTDVSEQLVDFILRVEEGATSSSEAFVTVSRAARRQNPEVQNLNRHYSHEDLRSVTTLLKTFVDMERNLMSDVNKKTCYVCFALSFLLIDL